MIYFVKCCCPNGFIKIGYTRSMGSRIGNLQTISPYPLEILRVISGTRKDETAVHKRFADLLERGEWFRPGEALLAYIQELAEQDLGPSAQVDIPFDELLRRVRLFGAREDRKKLVRDAGLDGDAARLSPPL